MGDDPTLSQSRADPRAAPQRVPCLRLLALAGRPADGRPLPLPPGESLLGRDGPLSLEDPRCSRRHARILRRETQVQLQDLQSRNGCFVEGRRVTEAELEDGDLVRLGDTLLLLRWEQPDAPDADLPGLFGRSPGIRAARALLAAVAPTDAPVLLLGETGTGKSLAARALHRASGRSGSFVAVNGAAIPENLAESLLFGHVAGAFSGATGAAEGYFKAADGGTLLLDEVAELSLATQARLLNVLDGGEVTPVGAARPRTVDVRVVAATHQDLAARVEDGRFRADLYARLAALEVRMPPLRERREDVLPLLLRQIGPASPPPSPDLLEALLLHPFPWNVRELERVATELKVKGQGAPRLELAMVEARLSRPAEEETAEAEGEGLAAPPDKAALEALLREHGGVVLSVARATGRSAKQVYRWLKRHGLDPERYRGDGGPKAAGE